MKFGVLSKFYEVKPTGKRPLGRPRRRWEEDVRIDFKKIGVNTKNWIDSFQDRSYWRALASAALSLRFPQSTE